MVLLVNEATKNLIESNILILNFDQANYTILKLANLSAEATGKQQTSTEKSRNDVSIETKLLSFTLDIDFFLLCCCSIVTFNGSTDDEEEKPSENV